MRRLTSLVLLWVAGCAGNSYQPAQFWPDAELVEPGRRAVEGAYPDRFRLVQRIVIELSGEQFDGLGALAVSRGEALRAVVLNELGGKLFDLLARGGGPRGTDRRVLKKPPGLPAEPLMDGVIGDLELLFDPRWPASTAKALAGRDPGGRPVLVVSEADRVREYVLDAAAERVTSLLEAAGGRVIRRAAFSDYRRFEGFERELPGRIVLDNLRWHYRLEIELLELRRPDGDLARAFEIDP